MHHCMHMHAHWATGSPVLGLCLAVWQWQCTMATAAGSEPMAMMLKQLNTLLNSDARTCDLGSSPGLTATHSPS